MTVPSHAATSALAPVRQIERFLCEPPPAHRSPASPAAGAAIDAVHDGAGRLFPLDSLVRGLRECGPLLADGGVR